MPIYRSIFIPSLVLVSVFISMSVAQEAAPAADVNPTPANQQLAADKNEKAKAKETKTKETKTKEAKAKATPSDKKLLPNLGSLKHSVIPGQPWRIHDLKRPRPRVVTPGSIDSMPPADAILLFNGENLDEWYQLGSEEEVYEAPWKVQDGYFEIEPRTGSIMTLESFGSCQLHIEWYIPEGTTGTSQGRGNSGVKLMERYEVQILDSFKNRTYADGQAASIYGQYPPLVNANRQQGEWQTYEIFFEAPTYEAGKQKRPPIVSVVHNGVLVQHHRELVGPTGLRSGGQEELPPAAPIMLQDHGNRIRFRNIWIRHLPSPM